MFQIFSLFVLALGFSGFILSFGWFDQRLKCGEVFSAEKVLSPRFVLMLGVVMAILTLLRLFFPHPGNLAVLGDILPVLSGALASLMLISDYFVQKSEAPAALFITFERLFLRHRNIIGVLIVFIALVHFIFPGIQVL
ncbi:hypothetical protein [Salinispira pacifica]|uniref:Uncharacterized protein n=1 Tax=Salinispira pacifica TaxID=1307761 RepID=V5WG77_9SPIO|nr:hypothetical protein [Salinispira pacifica]AHC14620.1 hypothetical protein L21SP2_1219 [Salinispira pacifica]